MTDYSIGLLAAELETTNSYATTKRELGQSFVPVQDDVLNFSPEEEVIVSCISLLSTCLLLKEGVLLYQLDYG